MSDNRNYSVITNFGCHWQCPYCIVRNTGIQIAETRMGATYDTVMDLADSGKMKFLSFSGGGDPLWGLDIRRAYWYASITRSLYEYDIETEMHTSMPSMVKRMYNLAPAVEFSRIVYHLRNVNMIVRGHHADNRGFTSVLFLERFKRARECLRAYRTNGIHKSRLPTVRSNQ